MDEPSSASMNEQDRQISEIVAEQRSRLRNFIRRRVPDPADAEDILQEVFYKLVDANRLLTTCVKSFREVRIEGGDSESNRGIKALPAFTCSRWEPAAAFAAGCYDRSAPGIQRLRLSEPGVNGRR